MLENITNPMGFSKSGGAVRGGGRAGNLPGRPARTFGDEKAPVDSAALDTLVGLAEAPVAEASDSGGTPLVPLIREWLSDLGIQGRSERTIHWYEDKMTQYGRRGGVTTLERLTSAEFKRFLAVLQRKGLSPDTVHGYFATIRAFAGWAAREGYPVDPSLFRVKAPKVPQKEMETYSEKQLVALLDVTPLGWPRLAILIMLGSGMRVSELCALTLEDVEDEGDVAFFKIRRGKGAKFRRVPISRRLWRELVRYLNRVRPETSSHSLLVRQDGEAVKVKTVTELLKRVKAKVGFRVHAHRFRHTFATEYLRQGGEIERLRRILGHTSYAMVMRYVHLDKGDLSRDFDQRSPF